MRLTHLGHACLLVEIADQRILVDPGTLARGWEELRDLDAVVVTAAWYVEAEARDLVEVPGSVPFVGGDEVRVGDVSLRGVGEQHAVINELIPRIRNTGVVISAVGEPTMAS